MGPFTLNVCVCVCESEIVNALANVNAQCNYVNFGIVGHQNIENSDRH